MLRAHKNLKGQIGDWSEMYLGSRCPAHIFHKSPALESQCARLVDAVAGEIRAVVLSKLKESTDPAAIGDYLFGGDRVEASVFGACLDAEFQGWIFDQMEEIKRKKQKKGGGSALFDLEEEERRWFNICNNGVMGLRIVLRTIREQIRLQAGEEQLTPAQLRKMRDNIPAIPVFVARFEGAIAGVLEPSFRSGFLREFQGIVSLTQEIVAKLESVLTRLRDRAMKSCCPAYQDIERFSLAVFDMYCEVYEYFYNIENDVSNVAPSAA